LKHVVHHGLKRELVMPATGADTVVYLAATAELPPEAAGGYFRDRQPVRACEAAYDQGAGTALWGLSAALTHFQPAVRPERPRADQGGEPPAPR
jgi:hypothetical protein